MGGLRGFDELDRRIIMMLSASSRGSCRQQARRLGVHPTTLNQRVRALEERGVIKGYRASVDYLGLGFGLMGVIQVYAEGNILGVQEAIASMPQVMAVFDVTGGCDSMVWVACAGREELSSVVKAILSIPGVAKTNTSVVLNVVKDPQDFVPDMPDGRAEEGQEEGF